MEYYEIPPAENLLLQSKGNNKKKLLVATATELSGTEHALLKKILLSIQLDLDEDCLLLQAAPDLLYPAGNLIETGSLRHLLLFGIDPLVLGLQISTEKYSFLNISNCRILLCDSLENLQSNQKAKQALWSELKQEFKG